MGVRRVATTDNHDEIIDAGHWMHDSWFCHGVGKEGSTPLCGATKLPGHFWFLATGKSVPDCATCLPIERYDTALRSTGVALGLFGPATAEEMTPSEVKW